MKRFVLPLVAAVALLAASARGAAPASVTHDATEKKSSVTIPVTSTLKIVLPARNDPGHAWQIIANDPRIIKPLGDVKPAATGKSADGAVPWEISFVAQRPGRSTVRFIWAKTGGTDVATADEIREVSVRVESLF